MTTLTQEQIKEVAEQLDCGFCCYYDKSSNNLLFVPDTDNHPDMELLAWKDDLKKIKMNRDKYLVIEPPNSSDSFNIMVNFVETLSDGNNLKSILTHALEKKKPFREFNFAVNNSSDYRQNWFDFKSGKLQEWVIYNIVYNADEEE